MSEREASREAAAVGGQEHPAVQGPGPGAPEDTPESEAPPIAPENEAPPIAPEGQPPAAGLPIRAAVSELDALADAPVAEHPAVYQRVHGALQGALSAIDDA